MIDNFEKVRNLLKFPNPTSFYFLEIIKRRKENPEMTKHASIIKDFYIYSLDEFDKLEGKIKELCDRENARAYFRLNLRDSKKIAFLYLKRLSELLLTEDYKNLPKIYASVVGEFHQDSEKKWLLDLDKKGEEEEDELDFITDLGILEASLKHYGVWIDCIKTKNGVHIITKPFRLDTFLNWIELANISVDVHKDNPTILYMP